MKQSNKSMNDHFRSIKEGILRTFIDLGGRGRVTVTETTTFEKIAQKIQAYSNEKITLIKDLETSLVDEKENYEKKMAEIKAQILEEKDLIEKFNRQVEIANDMAKIENASSGEKPIVKTEDKKEKENDGLFDESGDSFDDLLNGEDPSLKDPQF